MFKYSFKVLEELFVEKYYKKFPKEFKFKKFDKKTNTFYVGKVFSHWVMKRELKKLIEGVGLKVVSIQKNWINCCS